MYKHFLKRVLDILVSGIGLLCVGWLIIVLAIALHFANKGAGAFFYQIRPGKNNKPFRIYKFKSMTDERDEKGELLPDAMRLTKIGKFIRTTSLDELPQLLNVFVGDMSLIGPRPLVFVYVPYFNEQEAHRADVRPGITGWAQANGRKSIDWGKKLAYDVEYVNNVSFAFDMKVIFRTIRQLFDVQSVGVATSGTCDFYDYREREWDAAGRQDLIDKARLEKAEFLKIYPE